MQNDYLSDHASDLVEREFCLQNHKQGWGKILIENRHRLSTTDTEDKRQTNDNRQSVTITTTADSGDPTANNQHLKTT
jgi:hypothetical protein